MATFWLTNSVRVGTSFFHAGTRIDDSQTDTSALTAAGGQLYPTGNATVDAAAAKAAKLRANGQSGDELDDLMRAAVDEAQRLQDAATGTVDTNQTSEHNKLRLDLLKLRAGTIQHATASAAVATADAAATATAITLGNALKASYNAHIASACSATTGVGAHIAADAANAISSPDATDQGSVNTLLNELKADFNLHTASTTYHAAAGSTVATADASDEATSVALANALKVAFNAHYARAFNFAAL